MKNTILILMFIFISINIFSQENKYLLSKIAYEKANYIESLSYLDMFVEKYPENKKALFLKIDVLFKTKKYDDAKTNILKLNKHKDKDYYLLLARAWAGLNKKKESIDNLKLYIQTRYKKSEAIIKSYKEFDILIKNSEWIGIWKKDIYSQRERLLNNAKYAFSIKNFSEANIYLDKYLLKYKKSAEAYFLNAEISAAKNEYKNALINYSKAIDLEENSNEINLAYAVCLIELKKGKKALQVLNKIIENDSTEINAFYQRAKLNLLINKLEKAQEDIDFYLKYYSENEKAIYLSAEIDFAANDFLSAIPKFGKLIKQNPAKEEYFIGRANSYMKTKTYKYAINDYSMALDLNPKLANVYFKKANAHKELGEIKEACASWNYSYKLGNNKCSKLIYKYCK